MNFNLGRSNLLDCKISKFNTNAFYFIPKYIIDSK